ncbi:MAG: HAD-IA family hydrolase [Pseudomonadota bacterium]
MIVNTKKIRAVMFDLDGTLLDTAPDFVAVVNQLLVENNREILADDVIRACVSNGARALVMMAFDMDESHADFPALRLRLLELYTAHIAVFSKPFPGINALIEKLVANNIAWGIATNKPAVYTTPLMAQLNMQPAPTSIICPDHVSESKPHPESLFLAGKQLGCTPEQIIFVGDHKRDIECGKRAGSITIAAAYGYIDSTDNIDDWQADYRVEHADEIWPIVKKYL